MSKPTFEEWLNYQFLYRPSESERMSRTSANEGWKLVSSEHLAFIDSLFANPVEHTRHFSDEQISRGLWLLINEAEPDLYALFDDKIPSGNRVRVVQNMYVVFEKLFAARCSPIMNSYPGREESNTMNPLNSICYMWWDIIPLFAKSGDPIREALDPYCLDVMRRTLQLKSIACQESALHGFGHWAHAYPVFIQTSIDEFLAKNPYIDNRLHEYALAARIGTVL